jgi:serine/threonine protein phosphatase PrpC
MRIETSQHSESYRNENQDRVVIFDYGTTLIVAVADGVGGRVGGAEAAQSAVDHVHDAIRGVDKPALLSKTHFWTQLLTRIDDSLSDDKVAGETTLVALALADNRVTGASVGDSGAWLISHKDLRVLTEKQRAKPFLGSGAAFPVGFAAKIDDDTLLAATDGLLKYSGEEAICEIVRQYPLAEAPHRLVEMVRLRSGSLWDDTSVALCRVVK